jgi:DNA-binding response OmpR family regulator
MKVLNIGLLQPVIDAITCDKHVVVSCEVSDEEDIFEYIDCEIPSIVLIDVDTYPWILLEITRIRHRKVTVPVVGVVSPNCLDDRERRADFLEKGGNDLLVKPLCYREMIACLDSLHRLHQGAQQGKIVTIAVSGSLIELDQYRHIISVDGARLSLTPAEYQQFRFLIINQNKVVKKDDILYEMHGYQDVPECNSTEVRMARIRKKVGSVSNDAVQAIETIHGVGYRIAADKC